MTLGEIPKAHATSGTATGSAPLIPFGRPMEPPAETTAADRELYVQQAGLAAGSKLATLIIGVRLSTLEDARTTNLLFLLSWIDRYYADLFDVLIIEQDDASKMELIRNQLKPYVRCAFIYNPRTYNRGWGYNAAVRHYTTNPVVALLDTDVLTGHNFVQDVIDCHLKYYAVSPYANVYFTDQSEAQQIIASGDFSALSQIKRVSKPTTITGGMAIIRRDAYEECAGFEQYIGYGGEDRALDVTLTNKYPEDKIRVARYTYVHLYHPPTPFAPTDFRQILSHLNANYGCQLDKGLTPNEFLHESCHHVPAAQTRRNSEARRQAYGDLDLYRSGRMLTVNGCYMPEPDASAVIFPPNFKDLASYARKEHYDAPAADVEKIGTLYNKFKGQRCFIIGNGPSLNKHDLSLLEGELVFGVNAFYHMTDKTGFRPTFFVVEDTSVMSENIDRIRTYETPYKFFPTIYKDLHPAGDNVYFFAMDRGFYETSSPNYCVPRFSADASKVVYCGQSVTYINLQLAYFLGFTEVYLIGMDFDYVIPKEHERRGDLIISTTDDPNHFHKDYFGKGKSWKDPKLERVAVNYRQAKLSYESVGRRIFNATIGGKLEIFDRVDYEAMLRDPQTGLKRALPLHPAIARSAEAAPAAERPVAARSPDGSGAGKTTPAKVAEQALAGPKPASVSEAPPQPAALAPTGQAAKDVPASGRLSNAASWLAGAASRHKWTVGLVLLACALTFGLSLVGALPPLLRLSLAGAGVLIVVLSAIGATMLALWRMLDRQAATLRKQASAAKRQTAALQASMAKSAMSLRDRDDRLLAIRDRQITKLNGEIVRLDTAINALVKSSRYSMFDIVSPLRAIGKLWFAKPDSSGVMSAREHGHGLLMAALVDLERSAPGSLVGCTLVEIGTTREQEPNQGSTDKLAVFTALAGMQFTTVDMDPGNTEAARKYLRYLNPDSTAVTAKGEDFLATYDGSLDFVYLDAFDFDHGQHSEDRQSRYREFLGTSINDVACWEMHKLCADAIVAKMRPGGIVALDDTWLDFEDKYVGKGKLAIPVLLEHGFEVIAATKTTVVLRRS